MPQPHAVMAVCLPELSWYRQLATCAAAARDGIRSPQKRLTAEIRAGNPKADEPRIWHAFELADVMEQGLSCALVSSYTEPLHAAEREERLLLHRSPDRREFLLASEAGDELLLARATGAGRFDLYIPSGIEPPCALGPAFELTASSSLDRWALRGLSCESCQALGRRTCGAPELVVVEQYREVVGDGVALCMDVRVPDASTPSAWCPVCGSDSPSSVDPLTTRRPRWNRKTCGLILNFHGRCELPSSKNLMLDAPGRDRGPECEFSLGKVATDTFALNFRHPFGMVQAFAVALTAMQFK